MSLKMEVRTDIPLPVVKERWERLSETMKDTLRGMEPGGSVEVIDQQTAIAVRNWLAYRGRKGTWRKDKVTGVYRVWRVS